MSHATGLDEAALERLAEMVGPDVLQEIVELYREHTPQRIEAAREGLRSGTLDEVARAMHSLKSSAAMIGAHRVEEIAKRMEQTAALQRADVLAKQLKDLEAAADAVEAYLRSRESGDGKA